jgi:hypothetical protein
MKNGFEHKERFRPKVDWELEVEATISIEQLRMSAKTLASAKITALRRDSFID